MSGLKLFSSQAKIHHSCSQTKTTQLRAVKSLKLKLSRKGKFPLGSPLKSDLTTFFYDRRQNSCNVTRRLGPRATMPSEGAEPRPATIPACGLSKDTQSLSGKLFFFFYFIFTGPQLASALCSVTSRLTRYLHSMPPWRRRPLPPLHIPGQQRGASGPAQPSTTPAKQTRQSQSVAGTSTVSTSG